jgi:hypothetical protein
MTLVLLTVQAVAVAQSSSDGLGTHIVQGAVALILALQAWVIRAVTMTRDDVRMIRQSVFGVNNDNGIDAAVKDHESRIGQCEAYIERTVPERLRGWEAWKDAITKKVDDALGVVHKTRNAANEAVLNHTPRIEALERDAADRRTGAPDRRLHE